MLTWQRDLYDGTMACAPRRANALARHRIHSSIFIPHCMLRTSVNLFNLSPIFSCALSRKISMASPSLLPEASTITLTELQSTLALYEPLLMHLTLEDRKKVQKTGGLSGDFLSLDMQRFVQLPGMPNRTSMSKKEVTYAMDWKLYVIQDLI